MLDIRVTTVNKAKILINEEKTRTRKKRKKSPIIAEYEEYLKKLERGKALTFTLKNSDKYQTIKYRLNIAAKSLGIKNLKIERSGDMVIFYREVKTRVKKADEIEDMAVVSQRKTGTKRHIIKAEREPEPDVDFIDESTAEPAMEPGDEEEPVAELSFESAEAGTLLGFDFDEEWEIPLIHGYKTCETTVDRYDGDTFEAFGHQFVLTKVEQLPLSEVQQKWFKQHGLFSPREFQEVWKQSHGGVFDSEQKVWVHQFKRGFAETPELDAETYLDELPED